MSNQKLQLALGDVFYAQKIAKLTEKGTQHFTGGGSSMYCGILLAKVGSKHEGLTVNSVMALLGAAGFIGLDDIGDVLGKESQEKIIEHVQKKYAPDGNLAAAAHEQKKKTILTVAEARSEGIKVN